jgi:hypothetical protein
MKTIRLSAIFLMVLALAACTKSNDHLMVMSNLPAGTVTTDQAVDMVSGSLSLNSAGVLNVIGDVALNAHAYVDTHLACGTTKTDSVSRQNTQGNYVYSYKANYRYTLKCNSSNKPDSLFGLVSYSNYANGPRLMSNNSGSSNFLVSNLNTDSVAYRISGEYKTSGSFKSKVDTTKQGSDNVDIVLNNISVLKFSRLINNGNATFTLSGVVPKKGSFSYTGTIVFNSNETAKVTLNNGTAYIVNLLTGQTTKQ